MFYTSLPPGRNRMWAYSRYLDLTRERTINRRFLFSPIHIRGRNVQTRFIVNINPNLEYDYLTTLEDVKIGLMNKKLLDKSKVAINFETKEFCVICQDDIELNDIIRTVKCKHLFHINCIDKWFIENKKCPVCKYEL